MALLLRSEQIEMMDEGLLYLLYIRICATRPRALRRAHAGRCSRQCPDTGRGHCAASGKA
jgi:hypothetical protein